MFCARSRPLLSGLGVGGWWLVFGNGDWRMVTISEHHPGSIRASLCDVCPPCFPPALLLPPSSSSPSTGVLDHRTRPTTSIIHLHSIPQAPLRHCCADFCRLHKPLQSRRASPARKTQTKTTNTMVSKVVDLGLRGLQVHKTSYRGM